MNVISRNLYTLLVMSLLLVSSCSHKPTNPPQALTYQQLMMAPRYQSLEKALEHRDSAYKLLLINRSMEVLSPKIGHLYTLNTLEVTHNRLTTLPAEMSNLKVLQSLYAGKNKFRAIPAEVFPH